MMVFSGCARDSDAADTTTAESTGVIAGFLLDIMATINNKQLGLLQVDLEPLIS